MFEVTKLKPMFQTFNLLISTKNWYNNGLDKSPNFLKLDKLWLIKKRSKQGSEKSEVKSRRFYIIFELQKLYNVWTLITEEKK